MNWREAGNGAFFKKKGSFVEIALVLDVKQCCPVKMIESFRGSYCLAMKHLYSSGRLHGFTFQYTTTFVVIVVRILYLTIKACFRYSGSFV
jgi:hypothetical protein